ncbi:MAG TPA: ComEC/Rec2 family competence protein, partial [Polyangia bacterium]|nr:ComEC/Rec2 family competence protein [Polyangia bacterium]
MNVLPVLAVAWLVGVASGLLLPTPPWAVAVAAPLGLVAVVAAVRLGRGLALVSTALVFCLGWCRPASPPPTASMPPWPEPCPRMVEGRVAESPLPLEDGHRLVIGIERCSACLSAPPAGELRPAHGSLHVNVEDEKTPRFRTGDQVRLRAAMRPLQDRANPPGSHPVPALDRFVARAPRPAGIQRVARRPWSPVSGFFEELRLQSGAFWHTALPPPQARLARALSLGESRALDQDQREAFRRTGTAHLFAVSGLHLGLMVLLVFALTRAGLLLLPPLARSTDPGRIAAALAIPAAVGFALLAGARPPVMRACVMAVAFLAARALGRPASAPAALALAATALTWWDPEDLARPGFQLSFAAALAFVAVLRQSRAGLTRLETALPGPEEPPGILARAARRIASRALDLLRACVAASAATSPLTLVHFSGIAAVAVPANFLLLPVAAVLLPALVAISLLSGPAPGPARVLAAALGPSLGAIEDLARAMSALPAAPAVALPWSNIAAFGLCVAVLAFLARRLRIAIALAAPSAAILAAGLFLAPPTVPRDRLTLDLLDVGQGQAALVTFPSGRQWLVDAGGDPFPGAGTGPRVLVPVLEGLGVRSLETLVLTHPDPDHLVGGPAVLARFPVFALWDNGQGEAEGAHPDYHAILDGARRAGITVHRTPALCGEREVDGVLVAVLHPCHDPVGYDPGLSFNENSMVLRLTHGKVRMLLAG